jgi:hypothetical protein
MGESLPLPLPPREEYRSDIPETTAVTETDNLDEGGYEGETEDVPEYDDEEPEEMETGPKRLEYGNLTKDDVLPLARENMERTVGLLRRWIEQKTPESTQEK